MGNINYFDLEIRLSAARKMALAILLSEAGVDSMTFFTGGPGNSVLISSPPSKQKWDEAPSAWPIVTFSLQFVNYYLQANVYHFCF